MRCAMMVLDRRFISGRRLIATKTLGTNVLMSFLKAIGVFFIILVCVAIIAFAFAVPSLEKAAREQIIEQLESKLDAQADLKTVKLSSIWPLGLRLQELKIVPKNGQYRVDVGRLFLRYHYLNSRLDIDLEKPNVEWSSQVGKAEAKAPAPAPAKPLASALPKGPLAGFLANLGVEFFVREGIFRWQKDETTQIQILKLNIDATKIRILDDQEPLKILADADLHYVTPFVSGQTTVSVNTRDLTLKPDPMQISSQQTELAVGGLVLVAGGSSNFTNDLHDWKLHANVEDLQKLPRPPNFLPAQNWRGKIALDGSVHRDKQTTRAQGAVKFEKVSMDLRWDSPDLKANGPAFLDFHANFDWNNGRYNVKDLVLWAELSKASFQYSNLFKKPADIPFNVDFKGALASDSVEIQGLKLQLFNLNAKAQGSVPFKGSGKILWQTQPTNLVGWEKLILPMAQTPLKGTLELKGGVSGSFAAPKEMSIDVSKLSLQDFKGDLKYKSPDQSLVVEGPVSANVQGRLSTQGENVRAADIQARADLGALLIRKSGVFEKKAGEIFQVNVTAKQQKDDIGIQNSEFKLPFMTMKIGGRVHNPKDPTFDLNTQTDIANLESLKTYLPSTKEYPLTGNLKAQLNVVGRYASDKTWNNWPMRVSGHVGFSAPKFSLASSSKNEKGAAANAPTSGTAGAPAGFLPKGFLTQNLNVALDATVGRFVQDKLVLENSSMKGRISKGEYDGALTTHAFGGVLQLNNTRVPLLEPDPSIVSDVHFADIKIESILEFLKPELKDAAKGPSKGDVHVQTLMPGAPAFLAKLKAKGTVGSDNIWINTVSLNQMINEQISKVPGVPKNAVKLEPLQGRLQSQFNLENEKAEPLTIDGYDRGSSELHLKGSASLQQTVDLTGEFRLANAPISGCLKEGNSDDKGRLVVPLALKGPITSPSWSFATDVLAQMGARALRCEAVKALQKQIPVNIPGNVGDEIGKKLKDLLGH